MDDGLTPEQRERLRESFANGIVKRPDPEAFQREADAMARVLALREFRRTLGLDLSDEDRAAKVRAKRSD
jgi:hypothetical protein